MTPGADTLHAQHWLVLTTASPAHQTREGKKKKHRGVAYFHIVGEGMFDFWKV